MGYSSRERTESIVLKHYIKRKNNFQLENKQQHDRFVMKNFSYLEIKKHHFQYFFKILVFDPQDS